MNKEKCKSKKLFVSMEKDEPNREVECECKGVHHKHKNGKFEWKD